MPETRKLTATVLVFIAAATIAWVTTRDRAPQIASQEATRIEQMVAMVPDDIVNVLDVGSGSGMISKLLIDRGFRVTSIDKFPRPDALVPTIEADIYDIPFPSGNFDLVLCAEVLEHLEQPEQAANELARVSKRYVLIGVPNEQDLAVGRWRCACGQINNPHGHIQRFDRRRVEGLLNANVRLAVAGKRYERSNAISRTLAEMGDYYWGGNARDRCSKCGAGMSRHSVATWKRVAAGLGVRIERKLASERAGWVYALFNLTNRR